MRRRPWVRAAGLVAMAMVVVGLAPSAAASSRAASTLPPIKHVWVLFLENENAETTFGPDSPAPYLASTLPSMGVTIPNYYGIGHLSLDNYLATISGQAPNPVSQSDCPSFIDFAPPVAVLDPNGQAVGQGCVYPSGVPTLPDQLETAGLSWRGYMEDMGTPCRHPALNAQDETQSAKVGDQYAARHNPFVYFHSIIDDDASCKDHVVDLNALPNDLASVDTTPNFSFVTPNLCHDGHDAPCVDGQPGGLTSANAFLEQWVPKILASPAFAQDGMLVITFDEAEVGDPASATSCCGELPGPNSAMPGIVGPGGGRVGAVVLSPFATPGSTTDVAYNHYSLLRTLEDLYGVEHLGFAAAPGLTPMGSDVFPAAAPIASGTEASSPAPTANDRVTLARTGGSSSWAAVACLVLCAALAVRRVRARS
jgi:hypothetical protein